MDTFDHLSAAVVAGGVLLLAAALFVVRNEDAIDDVKLDSAQATQSALTRQIEIDFENLGARRPAGERPIRSIGPDGIEFYGVADTLGTPALIAYRAVEVDSLGTRLRVIRTVDGLPTGGSTGHVTRFEVVARDAAGGALDSASADAVATLDVRVQWAVPFERDSTGPGALPKRIGWETTVRPAALQYTY